MNRVCRESYKIRKKEELKGKYITFDKPCSYKFVFKDKRFIAEGLDVVLSQVLTFIVENTIVINYIIKKLYNINFTCSVFSWI